MENALLSGKFVLYPKTISTEVLLTNSAIVIKSTNSKPDCTISIHDIIGCHVLQGNKTTGTKWYICLFSYPLKKKFFKGQVRVRMARSLGVSCGEDNEGNKAIAEKWKKLIKYLISGKTLTSSQVDSVTDIPERKFIVYINPFSGRGKAMDMYQSCVKTMFAEAEIKHVVVKTEYAGHAKALVKELEVDKYDGIIIVSGDGLIHEIVNGLMERSDWKTAIKTPLGIVPGGSGNALAASIVYASTGLHPQHALMWSSLFQICRGNTEALDILSLETSATEHEEKKTLYGILGCVIGLISDVDIESERLRFLGGTLRSNIYAAMRIARLRRYEITLSYLPMEETSPSTEQIGQVEDDTPPEANDRLKHNSLSQNSHDSSEIVNDLLPPLNQPVPSLWRTVENSFLQVSALNLSHISNDIVLHSDKKLADGQISLTMLKGSMSRRNLLKLWDLLENGSGLSNSNASDEVAVVPCKAFRIVPHTKHSKIITIDGEKLPYGAFQCQIHKDMLKVFCIN